MTRRQTDTSAAAYGSIADASERLRAVVYRTLHAHPAGLTVDETCAIAKYPRYSLQPRFTELRDRKAIFDTGLRRRNVSGAKAIVWRIGLLAQPRAAARAIYGRPSGPHSAVGRGDAARAGRYAGRNGEARTRGFR